MSSYANLTRTAKKTPVVTPNDGADLPGGKATALYIGGAGDLKYHDGEGTVRGPTPVVAGPFPCEVKRVWATGTTATGILALYT